MHPGCDGVLQEKKQALTMYDINILSKFKHLDIAKRLGNKTSQNVVILMAALPCRQSVVTHDNREQQQQHMATRADSDRPQGSYSRRI